MLRQLVRPLVRALRAIVGTLGVSERLIAMERTLVAMERMLVAIEQAQGANAAELIELRRLAAEVEAAVLTLAVEGSACTYRVQLESSTPPSVPERA